MDGDRPMVNGCDLFKSRLQSIARSTVKFGGTAEQIAQAYISDTDRKASDVGAQDETFEERTMGDNIRSKADLIRYSSLYEDLIIELNKEVAKEFADILCKYHMHYPDIEPITGLKRKTKPDGSIAYYYFREIQNPR